MKKPLLILSCLTAMFAAKYSEAQMFTPDTIPLIIHVVHNNTEAVGTGRNLSQAQVMSQFPVLNADYAGTGWNVGNVPPVWASLVANTGIVFVPALVDTNGIPLAEPGIDRIDRSSKGWMNPGTMNSVALQNYLNTTIMPESIWDHNSYCNVWVLDMSLSGFLGMSTFPANVTAEKDGIAIHYQCWGDTLNVMPPFDHGRSATHEFGHWMGLTHPFNTCGPQPIADLPVGEYGNWFTSPVFPSVADTCAGYPDGPMFMNFMCGSYVGDSDIYMFTTGQASAMRQGLSTTHGSVTTSGVWHAISVQQQKGQEAGFVLFPNPSNGVLHIKGDPDYRNVSVKVLNMLGEEIYGQSLNNWAGSHSLSLPEQAGGVYFVALSSNGKTSIQKWIVE